MTRKSLVIIAMVFIATGIFFPWFTTSDYAQTKSVWTEEFLQGTEQYVELEEGSYLFTVYQVFTSLGEGVYGGIAKISNNKTLEQFETSFLFNSTSRYMETLSQNIEMNLQGGTYLIYINMTIRGSQNSYARIEQYGIFGKNIETMKTISVFYAMFAICIGLIVLCIGVVSRK